jgi:hypothetical protein
MECKGNPVEKVGSRSLKKTHLAVFDPRIDCGRLGLTRCISHRTLTARISRTGDPCGAAS